MAQTPHASHLSRLAASSGMAGVRRWGAGPPDVVLVHGAGGNRESLAPLGEALANRGMAAATVSMPGRVGSDDVEIESLADVASWLANVLAELAPDGTVLLGHSMGGGIAIETLLGTEARVTGLALVATGARLRVHPAILAAAAEMAEAGGDLAEISAASLRPDGPATARSHVLTVEALTPGAVALRDWQVTDRFDRLADVEDLDVPTLVVCGEVDQLTPVKYGEYLAEHAPSVELVVLPGAGHWCPVEEADQVADLVASFIRRLGR